MADHTVFSLGASFNDTNLQNPNSEITVTEDEILRNLDSENRGGNDFDVENLLSNVPYNSSLLLELNSIVSNEKLAPDLLPSYIEKIDEIVNLVALQKSKIKSILADSEAAKKKKRGSNIAIGPGGASLASSDSICNINNTLVSVMSMEISRIEYLLKCYYRVRLSKIEKFAVFYRLGIQQIADKAAENPDDEEHLNSEERDFYERFDEEEGEFVEEIAKNDLKLLHDQISRHLDERMGEHYRADKYLPRKWPRPNEDSYCFARIKASSEAEVGALELPDMTVIDPVVGKIYLLPFCAIKKRLANDIVLMWYYYVAFFKNFCRK